MVSSIGAGSEFVEELRERVGPARVARDTAYDFVRLIAKQSWIKGALGDYVTQVWRPALGAA
jgi:hypothetical protein